MKPEKRSIRGPGGLWVTMDASQIFPDSPGDGTPVMVRLFGAASTFWVAADHGYLDDRRSGDDVVLTEEQSRWLWEVAEPEVGEFLKRNDPVARAAAEKARGE